MSTLSVYLNRFALSCAAMAAAVTVHAEPPTPPSTPSATSAAPADAETPALPAPSATAQKLYDAAQNDLLQIRSLVKNGRTQSSVGSGFLIGTTDLVVTNYHVVSQFALEPDLYVGEFVDTHGKRGTVELLAVDVLHDVAVVRVSRKGTGYFNFGKEVATLKQGQYLYSLGNPLDLGFAISEGTYNGVIGRSLYDQLMFTGPINAGMSGGPNITIDGKLAGLNVSKRLDGELVSFLVPIRYAQQLIERVGQQKAPPKDFKKEITRQLLAHQATLVDRLLAAPLDSKVFGPYRVPVRESEQMRCWGRSNAKPDLPFTLDQINCAMESPLFISEQLQTGSVAMRHEYTHSIDLNALRFAQLASASFKNENFGNAKEANRTKPECTEQFVQNARLPMRAVLCVRAYRKFPELYDFALLTATTDESMMSLQSRIDAQGVSFENGMRLSKTFLAAITREVKP